MSSHELTIVVTARDSARTISRAIESVKKTGYPIVLVDDHSKDNTVELAREAGEGHVTVIRPLDRRGLGNARQTAIENVDTPFIAWLSAKDAYLPARIERVERLLRAGADLVFDSVEYSATANGQGDLAKIPAFLRQPQGAFHLFERNYLPSLSGPGARTEFARQIGYDTRLDAGADYDFLLRALRHRPKLALSDKAGYRSYVDPEERLSATLARKAEIYAEALGFHDLEQTREYLVAAGLGVREAYWKTAYMAIYQSNYRAARDCVLKAFPEGSDPHEILEPDHPNPRKEGWKQCFFLGTIDLLLGGRDEKDWLLKSEDYAIAAEALNNRGVACARRGDLLTARKCFVSAITRFIHYIDAKVNLKTLSSASRITRLPMRPRN